MISVLKIALPKEKLRALPRAERTLLLLLGHAANQISMFQKLITMMTNQTPDDPVEQKITAAHAQLLARFMIGVLHEAWRLVKQRFVETPLGREYRGRLSSEGREALAKLNRHFGRSNLLSNIRDDIAFHHPHNEDMDAAFDSAASDSQWDDDWNWYLSAYTFNSFYFASDLVIAYATMNSARGTGLVEGHRKIMEEIRTVSDLLLVDLIPALTAAIWAQRFGSEMLGEVCLQKQDAPSLFEYWIPFFVEVPPPSDTVGDDGGGAPAVHAHQPTVPQASPTLRPSNNRRKGNMARDLYQEGFTAGWLAASQTLLRAMGETDTATAAPPPVLEVTAPVPRRRGRPPKAMTAAKLARRKRGRPRKTEKA